MENRFQRALDNIVMNSCPQHNACRNCTIKNVCNSEAKRWIDTLQELINKGE